MRRTGQTTWDGKKNEPGWSSVDEPEVSVMPGYRFLSAWTNGTELRIHVDPIFHLKFCPGCGQLLTASGSYDEPEFVDSPQREFSCKVIVHRARYDCKTKHCHGRSDPMPGVDGNRHMTRRAINGIRRKAKRPALDTAGEYRISDKTVSGIFMDFSTEIDLRQKTTDRYSILAFDEKNIQGKERCCVYDAITHTILVVLPTDDLETIRTELETYRNRAFVEYILVDGTKKYDGIFAALYPQAIIVRDVWHLLKKLHECREKVRLAAYRAANGEEKKEVRGRKDFWDKVSDTGRWTGQQGNLLGPRAPSVAEANNLYWAFIGLFRAAKNREEAAQYFDYWCSRIPSSSLPYFQPFIDYVEPRRDQFFAYFDLGWTTGGAESSNRNLEDEAKQGRNLDPSGFDAKVRIQEFYKRQLALTDPGTQLGPVVSREEELSTEGSAQRDLRMIRIRGNASAAATPKPDAGTESVAE